MESKTSWPFNRKIPLNCFQLDFINCSFIFKICKSGEIYRNHPLLESCPHIIRCNMVTEPDSVRADGNGKIAWIIDMNFWNMFHGISPEIRLVAFSVILKFERAHILPNLIVLYTSVFAEKVWRQFWTRAHESILANIIFLMVGSWTCNKKMLNLISKKSIHPFFF